LEWFCERGLSERGLSLPAAEHAVPLFDHPCIGVAAEGDKPIAVSPFAVDSGMVSYNIAREVSDRFAWCLLTPPVTPDLSLFLSLASLASLSLLSHTAAALS
jgi:hypothetical protein